VSAGGKIYSGKGEGGVNGFVMPSTLNNINSKNWRIKNDQIEFGDFTIQQSVDQSETSYVNRLYIGNSGAATFSSSVTAPTFIGALNGNATTATKWQAPIALTIGNTFKAVDGTTNVAWSLAEIGALPLTGGSVSGVLTVNNANAIQFGNAAQADLYLGVVPGTRTLEIRNGNPSVPNYSACGLVTGTGDFKNSVTASGFFQSSDRRLKNIVKKDGEVAYFKWKDNRDTKTHIGYIAQEVKKEYPDQVQKDEKGMLSVNYIEVLVAKIQDLEKRIKQLEK
jgi:hypothetical protein